jgi:ADP-dependent NAD(P)H-hydrate dehydratase / NAD(P)H-hydrate epimerase
MKILLREQLQAWDTYTQKLEPISSIDLMNRAAWRCAEWLMPRIDPEKSVTVVCGPGNNGGDGFALARFLLDSGFKVQVYAVKLKELQDGATAQQYQWLSEKTEIHPINQFADMPAKWHGDWIVDALFGIGLNRPLEGLYADVVQSLNKSGIKILSLDCPSGMDIDGQFDSAFVVQATHTLTFQSPKLSFLLPSLGNAAGLWEILDIGLHAGFEPQHHYHYTTLHTLAFDWKPRKRHTHKGDYGRALLLAGSYEMMGAAVLAGGAALRSGLGLLTAHVPESGYFTFQTLLPECILSIDADSDHLTRMPDLAPFNAIAFGPGIPANPKTEQVFLQLLQESKGPLILDAGGLTLLGADPKRWKSLPAGSVLTPHLGEFGRLAQRPIKDDCDRLEHARELALRHQITIVLKGANSAVVWPDGSIHFNSTGNPGMATAGSGDVLTGIILALVAQGYAPHVAARMGVYLHGLAGDKAVKKFSESGLKAGDLIEFLPKAFGEIEKR